jgi:peptidoglycan/LPS O-acetylase OafA/YrhL
MPQAPLPQVPPVPQIHKQNPGSGRRYLIIDALRFILAFWVVMGHNSGLPPIFSFFAATPRGQELAKVWATAVFGTPAVICFFVISGFCIHLPFSQEKPPVLRFYLRRYTRIVLPVAGVLVIYRILTGTLELTGSNSVLWHSVLWSIVCEEIYYACYPLLRIGRQRFGWAPLVVVAFVLSEAIALLHWNATEWFDIGPILTALILLPVWLLGCVLAEQSDSLPPLTSSREIWKWRAIAWAASWACEMLHFHGGISQPQTCAWAGIIFYWWIRKEIQYGKHRNPSKLLVLGGAWSYSLYLVHPPLIAYFGILHLVNLSSLRYWFLSSVAILVFAYVFAVVIEFPSHRLARKIRLRSAPRARAAVVLEPSN